MGRATIYCDTCGDMVSGADIDRGRALLAGDKGWCPKCAPGHAPKASTPAKGSKRVVTKTTDSGLVRSLQTPVRTGATRTMPAVQAPAAPNRTPMIAGAVAAVVLVVGGAFFALSGKKDAGGGSSGASDEAESRAKKSRDRALEARGQGKAKAWLELLRAAKKDVAGTKYEKEIDQLLKEAGVAAEKEEQEDAIRSAVADALAQAAKAGDPKSFEGSLKQLRERAAAMSPELAAEVDAAIRRLGSMAVEALLASVDPATAGTAEGWRRAMEKLDEVAATPGLDSAAKAKVEAKRAACDAELGKKAEVAVTELATKVKRHIDAGRVEDAASDLERALAEFKGTPAAAKFDAIRRDIDAARERIVSDWVAVDDKNLEKQNGDARVEFAGGVFTLSSDLADDKCTDATRRVGFALRDTSWKNFEVELEFKVEKAGCAITVHPASGRGMSVRYLLKGEGVPRGVDPNRWYRFHGKVDGTRLAVTGDVSKLDQTIADGTGGFCVVIFRGAKLQIRNVKVRKLK